MNGNWPANEACASGGADVPTVIVGTGTDNATGSTPHVQLDDYYADNQNLGGFAAIGMIARVDPHCANMIAGSRGALHSWLLQAPTDGVKFWRPQGNCVLTGQVSSGTFTGLYNSGVCGTYYRWDRMFCLDGGNNLWCADLLNGLLVCKVRIATAGSGLLRVSPTSGSGGGMVGLFGTDHQGGIGRVGSWGIYEGGCPNTGNVAANSTPPPYTDVTRVMPGNFGGVYATHLESYTDVPKRIYPDLSGGWTRGTGTVYRQYPGMRRNAVLGYPIPEAVNDPYCPALMVGDIGWDDVSALFPGFHPAIPGKPAGTGLLAFDYWVRPADGSQGSVGPQDYFLKPLAGPDIGYCDPRSPFAAAQAWRTWQTGGALDAKNACIMYGNNPNLFANRDIAVLKFSMSVASGVDQNVGTPDHFSVSERVYPGSDAANVASTAAMARCSDQNNYMVAFNVYYNDVWLFDYVGGGNILGFTFTYTPTNAAYTKIGLWCKGSVVRVYVDNPAGITLPGIDGKWEQVGPDYTDTHHTAATRCGTAQAGISGIASDPIQASQFWAGYNAT